MDFVQRSMTLLIGVPLLASPLHADQRRVLVIGIDGMRPDAFVAAAAPSIDSIIAGGAVHWTCQAEDITISGPCWCTILTGVHRDKHLVVDNTFTPNNLAAYPHFFARLRTACPALRAGSIVHWAPINSTILAGNADVISTVSTDDEVRDAAAALVADVSPDAPDVIYLHFDDVDHAGHTFGYGPAVPQYIDAIEQTDSRVGVVMDALRARPTFASEDWLVIVTSDHGGSGTSHGQNIPTHRNTMLVVSGPSTQVATTLTGACTLADVAPTVATFLGIPIGAAWAWDGHPVGLDMTASPSVPFNCAVPQDVRGTRLSENFEGVLLGPSVNEATATGVWSTVPPAGWSVDDSGVPGATNPAVGVTEWEGWAFVRKDWWVSVAGDQNRSLFALGAGTIAVADPDEWDDRGNPAALGTYNARLTTPAVSLGNTAANSLRLEFDSSWRQEGQQRAQITVRYDGGGPTTVLDWRSSGWTTNLKPDAYSEHVRIDINNPPGASAATLEFALLDAGNNWWWAVDNVTLTAACAADLGVQGGVAGRDGVLDNNDFVAFIGLFFTNDPAADRGVQGGLPGSDGAFDNNDFIVFIGAFFAGCD